MPFRNVSPRAFALALAKSLGCDGAIDCARRNRWPSVLKELVALGALGCQSDCDAQAS